MKKNILSEKIQRFVRSPYSHNDTDDDDNDSAPISFVGRPPAYHNDLKKYKKSSP